MPPWSRDRSEYFPWSRDRSEYLPWNRDQRREFVLFFYESTAYTIFGRGIRRTTKKLLAFCKISRKIDWTKQLLFINPPILLIKVQSLRKKSDPITKLYILKLNKNVPRAVALCYAKRTLNFKVNYKETKM